MDDDTDRKSDLIGSLVVAGLITATAAYGVYRVVKAFRGHKKGDRVTEQELARLRPEELKAELVGSEPEEETGVCGQCRRWFKKSVLRICESCKKEYCPDCTIERHTATYSYFLCDQCELNIYG